jgi:hypothetical protein
VGIGWRKDVPKMVALPGTFAVKSTAECQAGRGDEFPERRRQTGKLPHRWVLRLAASRFYIGGLLKCAKHGRVVETE